MSTKRSRSPAPQIQPGADDLTVIDGIGPAIAQRLNAAGILTFAHLAALSPEEIMTKIGHQAGLSAARIASEDWIGQARALAAPQAPSQELETSPPAFEQPVEPAQTREALPEELGSRQHNATFTVELLLGTDGDVRRTRVAHFQSGQVELQTLCPGWDPARLVEYMVKLGGLRVTEPAEGTVDRSPVQKPAPQVQPDLSGAPTLSKLAVVPTGDERPHNVLHHDQTFQVQLALDLADVIIPAAQPLSYAATVLAKRMGSSTREKLGEACGQVSQTDTLALDIEAGKLTEGLYRLEAVVDLSLVSDTTKQQPTHKTQLRGGLLQIY